MNPPSKISPQAAEPASACPQFLRLNSRPVPVSDVYFLPRNGTEPDTIQANIDWARVEEPIPGRWEAEHGEDGHLHLLTVIGGHPAEPAGHVLIAATGESLADIARSWNLTAP